MARLWDPLDVASQSKDEVLSTARKREIQNILKSYVGFFDPFCELIQNGMDAVDARESKLGEPDFNKKLWIEVDLNTNSFSVTDNGIGFSESEFKAFLAPNISFKAGTNSRGMKGVGATYLAYGFNYLQLGTKTADYEIVAEFLDGRKWVEDTHNVITRPQVAESSLIHNPFNEIDRGSTFTIKFIGDTVRPKNLSWISATNAEQWAAILLIKTPLGHIELSDSRKKPITFDLRVIDRNGDETIIRDRTSKYIFPHDVVSACVDNRDILREQQNRIKKGLDPGKLPERFKKQNGIFSIWSSDDLIELLGEGSDHEKLIKEFGIQAYGFFCYSVKIWDHYNDTIMGLRRGMRILRGGLQLATNNMPQGELITIPLTSNIGYQNQAHVVVHFENADPDLGRKGFQPELREVAEAISVSAVNTLKRRRQFLKKDTGAAPSITSESELHDWIKQQEEHERSSPLSVTNDNFFLPTCEVSITASPSSEQDVIVLFNQLIAGGVIRGIKLLAASQHDQYDAVFRFKIEEPFVNYIFDKDKNPLGVQDFQYSEPYISRPYVLEYKYNIDALIQDFENGDKAEGDIDLIVSWEMGDMWKRRYSVTSLLDLDNLQHRELHGITHIFLDENSGDRRFYGIILSELVDYLNDIDRSQKNQKEKYGEAF